MTIDDINLPDDLLILWREKEREYHIALDTGTHEEMEAARADYDKVAHGAFRIMHTAMMSKPINEGVTH